MLSYYAFHKCADLGQGDKEVLRVRAWGRKEALV